MNPAGQTPKLLASTPGPAGSRPAALRVFEQQRLTVTRRRVWTVPGTVVRVVDGDTLVCLLDLGWSVWLNDVKVRVSRIDCPELGTAEGKAAAARCRQLCPAGAQVVIVSQQLDKYGRVLAAVQLGDGRDLGAVLVEEGHAAWAVS